MPKTDATFDPADYAPVAERITLFYERHPTGRIVTRALRVSEGMVLFRAQVYRSVDEREPAATGYASERPGDGEINTVACVENTETSAIGRALANLGITAGRQRPSREEMQKAARGRLRARQAAAEGEGAIPADPPADAALATADDLVDLEELLAEAERRGYPDAEALEVRRLLERVRPDRPGAEPVVLATVRGVQRTLRAWLARRDRAR